MTDEARLLADIEALRPKFTDTQDLYREVCTILFFRYGITPTANKLYQLVRKGSMSAPAEALGKFWDNLRDKSRVRIEHPDIPEALRDAAGELVAQLWQKSRTAAEESYEMVRLAAQQQVDAAHHAAGDAQAKEALAQQALATAQEREGRHLERIRELEQRIAHEEGLQVGLTQQVQQLTDQLVALGTAVDAARSAEQRAAEEHKRLLLEIDRERANVSRARKEAESLKLASDKASLLHDTRIAQLLEEAAQLRQSNTDLEVALAAASAERDQLKSLLRTDDGQRPTLAQRRRSGKPPQSPQRRRLNR